MLVLWGRDRWDVGHVFSCARCLTLLNPQVNQVEWSRLYIQLSKKMVQIPLATAGSLYSSLDHPVRCNLELRGLG